MSNANRPARWLAEDAIRPWQHRSWIFPRDPRFSERAGPVLETFRTRTLKTLESIGSSR
jgi:hypothetical protein